MNTTIIDSTSFLDMAATKLRSAEEMAETMTGIFFVLNAIRQYVSETSWKQFVTSECRQHPLMQLLHQDPLTLRAFTKPRGYALFVWLPILSWAFFSLNVLVSLSSTTAT